MLTHLRRLARRIRPATPPPPAPRRPGPPTGWVLRQPRPGQVHVVPTDDLIAHEAAGGCLCKPWEKHYAEDDLRGPVVITKHKRLWADA